MSSEVTRFQLARAPMRACIDEKCPPLRLETWLVDSDLMNALSAVVASNWRDVAGQKLNFWKAKAFGINAWVLDLGHLNGLPAGSRTTFSWLED